MNWRPWVTQTLRIILTANRDGWKQVSRWRRLRSGEKQGAERDVIIIGEWMILSHSQEKFGLRFQNVCVNFKLRPRSSRENHHAIVLDLAQGELGDAAMQRKASQLGLARVR